MWKCTVQPEKATDDNTIKQVRFACQITKAISTHSEYVQLLVFAQ